MSTDQSARKEIRKSVKINASRDQIWNALFNDENYVEWCSAFWEGSYFRGDWSIGTKMRFLGPSEDGTEGGMISEVVEHNPGHILRLKAVGVIEKGEDRYDGEDVDQWIGSPEEYVLVGELAPYELRIYVESPDSMVDYFDSSWDSALERIKKIAEQN